MAKYGKENNNWKGGRSVASNGYVLVRLGVGHHLSDVRGYAYEHRVVAEDAIGRRLVKGEIVHHKDGDKANNKPENLEVMPSLAHHLVEHRGPRAVPLRKPNEANITVLCACGCGGEFSRYDTSGRPRRYLSGHNNRTRKGQQWGKQR